MLGSGVTCRYFTKIKLKNLLRIAASYPTDSLLRKRAGVEVMANQLSAPILSGAALEAFLEECVLDGNQAPRSSFNQSSLLPLFLDAVPDGLVVLNSERRIVYANAAFLRRAGKTRIREVAGQRVGAVLGCSHSGRERSDLCGTTKHCTYCGTLEAALRAKADKLTRKESRVRLAKENAALDFEVSSTRISFENQHYVVLVLKDIADQKRKQALERTFFHDILGTVSAIQGFSEILQENNLEHLNTEGLLKRLSRLCRRLSDEVASQRVLAAAEKDDFSIQPGFISSKTLLEDVKELSGEEDTNQHVYIHPSSEDIHFESDLALVRRVLCNMLKNALEASVADATITISSRLRGRYLEFSVHNPGVIAEDVQHQIFNRSFSTKGEGRGIGTYSMKFLSERYLKGSVRFFSTEKEGTTFTARYPITLKKPEN